ncbi:helix-turn-helix transcriptional regulator [Streptomyces sp. R302]|uniref:helix-turn-helix domain-containing protein n=1 Tax=unclassified Streptomyces TaxID=2593676 RepID=UPI00145D774B|nr:MULTISPECIES: helix-turn-helix transcriptional regulator [unclassified Streptomyces]NML53349.1 helix-turn-helix transcriptional regulator [Streptomyces sp. R301]NML78303.1 helix-turn-helix transcriptional regulator [Streptomyces sp. R302]
MSSHATPDPYASPIAFGQRMQILRERRGMTRQVLAGLLGRSPDWVKSVEAGRMQAPGLEMVYRIAEALRVRELADLTGHGEHTVNLFTGPGHPRLGAVREAIEQLSLGTAGNPPPTPAHLAARLEVAWTARHRAPDHRDRIGAILPGLIRDAQLAVEHAETPSDWRAAQAVLAETYSLAQFFLAYQPDASLLWRVAERSMVAARQSGDPHAVGVSAWLLAQAHRDTGPSHYDAADDITAQAIEYLEPLLPDADATVLAVAGALQFEAGYTAARRGATATAWSRWDTAREMAERLPEGYYHPITSFSEAIMGAHAVTVAVELHQGAESVRQAARADATTIPSRPRRARHRIEEARGYHLDGQPDVALATLAMAHEAAPETIRYNGYARSILLEACESKVTSRRRRASELAVEMGLLAA